MTALRAALVLILAGGASTAFADQITCESHQDQRAFCQTGGGSVSLVQQISNSPCIEGRTWGSNTNGIWVSGGCRATFDVERNYSYNDEPRDDRYADGDRRDERLEGSRYAGADHLRGIARRACIDRASAGQSFDEGDVSTNDERWLGDGLFAVDLDTPSGRVECTVDRDGNVRSFEER